MHIWTQQKHENKQQWLSKQNLSCMPNYLSVIKFDGHVRKSHDILDKAFGRISHTH